jgi:erythromycin esterase-like protein
VKTLRLAAAVLTIPLALGAQTPAPTKTVFDPGKAYTGVLTQQGRVQTDADWNEQVQACKRQNEALKQQLRSRANELQIQANQLQAAVERSDENKKSSQDHNKAMKDSIRKMLEQIAEINRATKL